MVRRIEYITTIMVKLSLIILPIGSLKSPECKVQVPILRSLHALIFPSLPVTSPRKDNFQLSPFRRNKLFSLPMKFNLFLSKKEKFSY